MENLALQRMEMDKLREKIELLEGLQMERVVAVEAIAEERERRKGAFSHNNSLAYAHAPYSHNLLTGKCIDFFV